MSLTKTLLGYFGVLAVSTMLNASQAPVAQALEFTVSLPTAAAEEEEEEETTECFENAEVINEFLWQQEVSNQQDLLVCFAHSAVSIYRALYAKLYQSPLTGLSPLMLGLYCSVYGYKSASFLRGTWSKKMTSLFPEMAWIGYLAKKNLHQHQQSFTARIAGGDVTKAMPDLLRMPPCSQEAAEGFLDFQEEGYSHERALTLLYEFIKADRSLTGSSPEQLLLAGSDHETFQATLRRLTSQGFTLNPLISEKLRELSRFLHSQGYTQRPPTEKKDYERCLGEFFLDRCRALWSQEAPKKMRITFQNDFYASTSQQHFINRLASHFVDATSPPVELSYRVDKLQESPLMTPHSSIIYGKKCEQGRLYFLLRNTWGGRSMRIQRQYSYLPGRDEGFPYLLKLQGDFWVSLAALRSTMTDCLGCGVTYFNATKTHNR